MLEIGESVATIGSNDFIGGIRLVNSSKEVLISHLLGYDFQFSYFRHIQILYPTAAAER